MPEKAAELGTWTSVRLTERERQKIAAIARRENRKMAQQIRQFIYEGLERRGCAPAHDDHDQAAEVVARGAEGRER